MFNKDQWIELSELMLLFGYSDERSIKKWCKDNAIPVIKMGLKKYILLHFLTQIIDNQLVIFEKRDKNANSPNKNNSITECEIVSKYFEKFKAHAKATTSKKGKA